MKASVSQGSPAWGALDTGIEGLLHLASHLPVIDPVGRGLSRFQGQIIKELVPQVQARLVPLVPGVRAGVPAAVSAYDQIVLEAIHTLRTADGRQGRGWGPAVLGVLDRWLYRDGEEILDDASLPLSRRQPILEVLDRLNQHLGSYRRWCERIAPLVEAAEGRGAGPVEIHDLAAGHGGFAIALKEHFGDRVVVTASDLREEYLALGRARARAQGVAVRFVEQDATRLDEVQGSGGAGVDLFLCTQSLHHFPPGMVARMLGGAARAARTGVVFIDGERGYFQLLLAPLLGVYGRRWPVVHDTWVSVRRMYLAQELELLGLLGLSLLEESAAGIKRPALLAERVGPGHAIVTIRSSGSGHLQAL